jgi:hypothetical protein
LHTATQGNIYKKKWRERESPLTVKWFRRQQVCL